VVAFGGESTSSYVKEDEILGGRIWCDAVFRRAKTLEDLDIDEEVRLLRRKQKTVEVECPGIIIKCHIRSEIISSQPVFCVDVCVKPIDDKSTNAQ